jgi:hypothetical protein
MHNPYSDAFFSELRAYLSPSAQGNLSRRRAVSAGGVLARTMLVEDGIQLPCHVTTNVTKYNVRVEKFLERIPFSF